MPSRPSSLRRLITGGPGAWVRRGALLTAVVLVGVGLATSNGLHSEPVELDDGSAWTVQGRDLVHGSAESGKGDWLLAGVVGEKGEAATKVRIAQDGKHTVVVDPSTGDVFGIDPVNLTDKRADQGDGEQDASAVPLVGGGDAYLVSDGAIRWIDPVTTDVKKTIRVREGKVVATIDDDGILWAYTPRSGVLRRVRDGKVTGDVRLLDPGAKAQVTLAAGVPVVLDESSRTLHWINRRTGESSREVELPANGLLQGRSTSGDRVWISMPTRESVLAVSPDGKATETEIGRSDLRRPEVTDGEVYVTSEGGRVDVLDADTAERTVADKALKVAARSDFQSFVKDNLVWFSSPTARQSGTLAPDGSVKPIDVDRDELLERSAATPDVDEVAIRRIAEPERRTDRPEARRDPEGEPRPTTRTPPAATPIVPRGPTGTAAPEGSGGATGPSGPVEVRPTPGAGTAADPVAPATPTPDRPDQPADPPRRPAAPARPADPAPNEPNRPAEPAPEMVEVPDVIDDPAADACETIRDAGLTCDPGSQPTRKVTTLNPAQGTQVEEGSAVSLTVQGDIEVPDVATMTPDEACAAIEAEELECVREPAGRLSPVDAEPQSVIEQSPAADQSVAPDSVVTIRFYEAKGVEVPGVINQTGTAACATIQGAGLTCNPGPHPARRVIAQAPDAGTLVEQGSAVAITPQGDIPVPNVADGRSPAAACAAIEAAGLGCTRDPYGTLAPAGQSAQAVAEQIPAGGQPVAPDSAVTIRYYEAQGATVPNVIGESSGNACAAIRAAGLGCNAMPAPSSVEPVPPDTVWHQDQAADGVIQAGSTVTVTYDATQWQNLYSCKPGGGDPFAWDNQRFFLAGTQPGGWTCASAGLVTQTQIPGTAPLGSVAAVTGEEAPVLDYGSRFLGYVLAAPYRGSRPVTRYVGRSSNWLSIDPNDSIGVALVNSDTAAPVGYSDIPYYSF